MSEKTLKPILIILGLLNIADYLFTQRAFNILLHPEANPLINLTLGTPWFFIVKVIGVSIALLYIWHIREKWMQNKFISRLLFFVTFAYSGVTVWHLYGQFVM